MYERHIQKLIYDNWKEYFGDYFDSIKTNEPIFGIYSKKQIGEVDLIFSKRKTLYYVELKYSESKYNLKSVFWNSLKVLGYSINDSLKYKNNIIKPVVMLNKSLVNEDIFIILFHLNISYIIYEYKEGKFSFNINLK